MHSPDISHSFPRQVAAGPHLVLMQPLVVESWRELSRAGVPWSQKTSTLSTVSVVFFQYCFTSKHLIVFQMLELRLTQTRTQNHTDVTSFRKINPKTNQVLYVITYTQQLIFHLDQNHTLVRNFSIL